MRLFKDVKINDHSDYDGKQNVSTYKNRYEQIRRCSSIYANFSNITWSKYA